MTAFRLPAVAPAAESAAGTAADTMVRSVIRRQYSPSLNAVTAPPVSSLTWT